LLLVSTTALFMHVIYMSLVEMPLSEAGFDRNISVHTQHDSSESYKSGGTSWPHRVMIIKVCVHIVVVVELHAVVKFGPTGAG
jgi:hypothetical protein